MKKKINFIPYKYSRDFYKNTTRLLKYLHNGGMDQKTIQQLCLDGLQKIDECYDCSDFRAEIFVRVLYKYADVIGTETQEMILQSLCRFPFFETEGNSMCTWTENHQLVFMVGAYLLGQKYPQRKVLGFDNGLKMKEAAQRRLEEWVQYIYRFGFSEFGSCNYYPETMAALGNLLEFGQDKQLIKKYKIVLDLLLIDVFSTMLPDYSYDKATARAYIDNKMNHFNYLNLHIRALMGEEIKENREREICFIEMLQAKDQNGNPVYQLPEVFLDVFYCEEKEIREANGVDPEDYVKKGIQNDNEADTRYKMTGASMSDRHVVKDVVQYFDQYQLWQNAMLQPLRPYKELGKFSPTLFNTVRNLVHDRSDDMTFGRGDTYTYIKGNCSMSSLQNYHVGRGSFQQVSHVLNLDGLAVFSTSPKQPSEKQGYWVGSAVNPDCRQYKNTLILIYDFEGYDGYGKNKTHLFIPLERFNKTDLSHMEQGVLFGQYHGINLMIRTNPHLQFADCKKDLAILNDEKIENFHLQKYDVLNNAQESHYYIFETDDTLPFERFIQNSLSAFFKIDGKKIQYKDFEYIYNGYFKKGGKEIGCRFHRFENRFIQNGFYDYDVEKPLVIASDQHSLTIDFKTFSRKEQ